MQTTLPIDTEVEVTEPQAIGGRTYQGRIIAYNDDESRYLIREEMASGLFQTIFALPRWVRVITSDKPKTPPTVQPLYNDITVSVHNGQVLLRADDSTAIVTLPPLLAVHLAIKIQQACGDIYAASQQGYSHD